MHTTLNDTSYYKSNLTPLIVTQMWPTGSMMLLTALIFFCLTPSTSFSPSVQQCFRVKTIPTPTSCTVLNLKSDNDIANTNSSSRRQALASISGLIFSIGFSYSSPDALAADESLSEMLSLVEEARRQLDAVSALIEKEQWDSVRAILIKPPLSDCWTKSARPKQLLVDYAEVVGSVGGDELGVLEGREEAITHLRFLDMAVYNNIFNPIKSEGTSGATKELIRSYYEDPKSELKASVAALDSLVGLGKN